MEKITTEIFTTIYNKKGKPIRLTTQFPLYLVNVQDWCACSQRRLLITTDATYSLLNLFGYWTLNIYYYYYLLFYLLQDVAH